MLHRATDVGGKLLSVLGRPARAPVIAVLRSAVVRDPQRPQQRRPVGVQEGGVDRPRSGVEREVPDRLQEPSRLERRRPPVQFAVRPPVRPPRRVRDGHFGAYIPRERRVEEVDRPVVRVRVRQDEYRVELELI